VFSEGETKPTRPQKKKNKKRAAEVCGQAFSIKGPAELWQSVHQTSQLVLIAG